MTELLNLCLLVDDDPDDQEVFEMCIRRTGLPISLQIAGNAPEALEWLNNHPHQAPHWIFLDVNMPRMNGIECLEVIRRIERLQDSRIYMYSTTTDSAVEARCAALGAAGFIVKPVKPSELTGKLKLLLSANQPAHE